MRTFLCSLISEHRDQLFRSSSFFKTETDSIYMYTYIAWDENNKELDLKSIWSNLGVH